MRNQFSCLSRFDSKFFAWIISIVLISIATVGTKAVGFSFFDSVNELIAPAPIAEDDKKVPLVNNAIDFDGTNDHIVFGDPAPLKLTTFTIETWFRRDGAGAATSTGTGGLTMIPLVTKGRAQDEMPANLNMNYFLGINNSTNVLAADFEEATGPNHPILGRTVICNGVWYHAAATYDGTKWQLFLNGQLENEEIESATPASVSIQHFGIATAFTSTPAAAGFFNGAIDDVRIWNSARTASQIQSNLGVEIPSAPGLVGSWNMNEGAGGTTADTSGNNITGTLTNGPLWTAGTPFSVIQNALDLTPNTYVTFGAAPGLNAVNFTLEAWIRRDAAGTPTPTGTGGLVNAVPIIAKGRGETDNADNLDTNYFFGIDSATNALAVDFEEGAGQPSPSLNHPFIGTTPLALNTWYHVAATYDGSVWRLYVNGNLDATSPVIGRAPRSDSIQHSSIGSALTSTGAAAGFFDGAVDEARIWNVVRTQSEIQAGAVTQITSGTGLLGRWGFNTSCGTDVYDSDWVTPINGSIITGTGSSAWVAGSPFTFPNLPPNVSAGPDQSVSISTGATLAGAASDDGLPTNTLTTTWSQLSGPGTATFTNANVLNTQVNFSAIGVYVLRLTASDGALSATDDVQITVNPAPGDAAIDFGGTNAYVTFGNPAELHLNTFTIETRFRRDGTGVGANTGTGGIPSAIPLVTRGFGEGEATLTDTNYFLGIDATTNRLGADFEEGAGGASPSLNHPIIGTTTITNGVWHHAAATYDGNKWQLFLDGVLEAELVVGQPVAAAGNQHAGIASALSTTGAPNGFFDGAMDEVRVWNYAQTPAEIRANANTAIPSGTGLVARWGLNEASGTAIADSTTPASNGTVTGANWTWIVGSPVINLAPLVNAGPDLATTTAAGATMAGSVNDDGLIGPVTSTWSQVSGPGASVITSPTVLNTTVSFPVVGTYVLRLTANDGANSRSDDVSISVTSTEVSVSFRDGVNSYAGTVDTYLRNTQPSTPQGASATLEWDTDEGTGGGPQFTLIRFDDIFGAGPGQIPPGVFITSATLSYTVFDPGDASDVNEAAVAWDETATFNDYGGEPGVQADEYGTFVDSAVGNPNGTYSIDVTTSITNWLSNPAANRGWIFRPLGSDGVDLRSSDHATIAERPILSVTYSTVQPNRPPNAPVLISPINNTTAVPINANLTVDVSDPDGDPLTVTYFGRPAPTAPGADFTIIALPDTQYYSSSLNGGSPAIFNAQTQWIVGQRAARNIAFVTQLGDCVEHGDNGGDPVEWNVADTAFDFLEDPMTTTLPHGMPYGIAVGNHDQSPVGDPNGATTFYNQFFGESRFLGRPYYGGHYGTNNDNHYELFSASGLDFIIIHLEYDPAANPAVLAWANGLLQANPTRRGILVSHHFVNTGNPATFGTQGQATYNALRANPNFFLMLNGHVAGEGRRQDTFSGNTVNSLLADYQSRTNGGNGWLRILTFSPATDQIRVQTFSPTLNQFETDADSDFTLSYNMQGSGSPFGMIGQNPSVPGFTSTAMLWPNLLYDTQYEWYVTVSDGQHTVTSPIWNFRTVLAPTAARVSVSGQVVGATGRAIPRAIVSLSNQRGERVSARTNVFGYFRFDNIEPGATYVLEVRSRAYSFTPRTLSVTDNIGNLVISADP